MTDRHGPSTRQKTGSGRGWWHRLARRFVRIGGAPDDTDWRAHLSPMAYKVMRRHATEPPYSSALNGETRAGLYRCAGCDAALYDAADKFDSRTGWPSFTRPVAAGAIGTRIDFAMLVPRTECHCACCGGHLGHVFNDGPQPTGQRHCINGVSLRFVPAEGAPAT